MELTRAIFYTAVTLDGFLADPDDSLEWLFAVPGAAEAESGIDAFTATIGAVVMGSTTYLWLWEHEVRDSPERWADFYGERPVYVFSSRDDLPVPAGAENIRIVSGDPAAHWPRIAASAGDRDVWLVGGGDLVGQFADAGHLDAVQVSIAPVTLGAGRPLLPRRFGADRLTLRSVSRAGQFAELVYDFR